MTHKQIAGALVAAAALASPAAAVAHPSVYQDIAKAVAPGDTPPIAEADLIEQTRYVAANHGFTYVLRETNGATSKGILDYKAVPGAYRNQPGFEPGALGTRTRLLSEADTGAQAHATCDVAALNAESAILGWQGSDPFYNYVPFQALSAGLEDNPSDWLDDVATLTGVTLTPTTDLAAACTGIGGTLVPADTTVSSNTAFNSGLVAMIEEPLESQIDTLTGEKATLAGLNATLAGEKAALTTERDALQVALDAAKAGKAAAEGDAANVRAQLAAAQAEVARLALQAAPLTLALADAGKSTMRASVTGPPSKPVNVRVLVSDATRRTLKLRSRVIATGRVTTAEDGKASIAVKPGLAAAAALAKAKRTVGMTAEARSSDRIATATGKLTR